MVNCFVTRFDTFVSGADDFMACMRTLGSRGFAGSCTFLARFDTGCAGFCRFVARSKTFLIGAISLVTFEFFKAFSSTLDELFARRDTFPVQNTFCFVFIIAFFARIDELFAELYAFTA
jgi:hypothetical protein